MVTNIARQQHSPSFDCISFGIAYTVLGIVLIVILREGPSLFGIQKFIGKYGELILGPALVLIGVFMLFGNKLKLPSFGFNGNGEGLARKGGWCSILGC